jgi:hypothetical protein
VLKIIAEANPYLSKSMIAAAKVCNAQLENTSLTK